MTPEDYLALSEPAKRYARCVDRCEFDDLPNIFAQEARLIAVDGAGETLYGFDGLEEIAAALELISMYDACFHMLGQQQLLELAGDTARTETYCTASHFHQLNGEEQVYVMYIRYVDELRRVEGGWQFLERRLCVDARTGVPAQP